MAQIAGLIKRAPKWAWVTAAGVGIGGVAVYTVKNRATPTDETTDSPTDTIGDPPTQLWDSSPVPGIVVPPIVTPGGGDTNVGVTDLQNLYIDATGRTLDLLAGGFGSMLGTNVDLTHAVLDQNTGLQSTLAQIITGGGLGVPAPPGAVAVGPFPAAPVAPAPTPAPPGCPPQYPFRGPKGCYQVATSNECKCTGTGRTRKCWTLQNRWHIGQSGYRDVVSQNKVKDGC
jgi:hypothetical protein